MNRYLSDLASRLVPYVPGEQPRDRKYIKLNTNENPYPPSPKALEAIREAAGERLRLYPDPTCDGLRNAVGEVYGRKKEEVFIGNGSDEILAFCFQAFFNPDQPILFPDITYSFYPVYAGLYGIPYKLVRVGEDFTLPVEDFFVENGGILFPNPNAPTAIAIETGDIRRILEHNRERVVVVDEAYIDFGGESAVSLLDEHPNLLVVQTLSKSRSLAGLRVGYALGSAELIDGLDRVKNSFNSYTIDTLALNGAAASVRDLDYFNATRRKVMETRDRVVKSLREMGFTVTDSKANFLFITHPDRGAGELFTKLRDKGILVRYFNKPRIDNHLRVSIGTDEEMDAFLEAAGELVQAG